MSASVRVCVCGGCVDPVAVRLGMNVQFIYCSLVLDEKTVKSGSLSLASMKPRLLLFLK